jgi:DNA-binding IclR family transcriptional regulator
VSSRDAQQVVSGATDALGASYVQSVHRAAALLRAVAAAPTGPDSSATALAAAVGLNRTTTWRLLHTLERERLVRLDRETGWYSLGFGLVDLAGQAAGESLAASAGAVLRRLAARSGETAALAVPRGAELTYVAEVSAGAVVSAGWLGRTVPVHATSTGKVLLAWSDPADARVLLDPRRGGRLPRHTPTTLVTLGALEADLAETRRRGYAVCRGEFESTAWGVSAPVLDVADRVVAVVSVWGPSSRLTEDRFAALGALAVEAAGEIAA